MSTPSSTFTASTDAANCAMRTKDAEGMLVTATLLITSSVDEHAAYAQMPHTTAARSAAALAFSEAAAFSVLRGEERGREGGGRGWRIDLQ